MHPLFFLLSMHLPCPAQQTANLALALPAEWSPALTLYSLDALGAGKLLFLHYVYRRIRFTDEQLGHARIRARPVTPCYEKHFSR